MAHVPRVENHYFMPLVPQLMNETLVWVNYAEPNKKKKKLHRCSVAALESYIPKVCGSNIDNDTSYSKILVPSLGSYKRMPGQYVQTGHDRLHHKPLPLTTDHYLPIIFYTTYHLQLI
jgi:hypothetical protein